MNNTSQNQKGLDSFCQPRSSLKLKIALSTFYNVSYSHFTDKLISLVEYFQLLSFILFLSFPDNNNHNQLFVFRAIVYFFKLINPSYLLDFGTGNNLTQTILIIIFLCTILKYLLIIYIILFEYWNKRNKINIFFYCWKWIFKIQGRVICSFISSFAVRVIIASSDHEFKIFGINKLPLIIICALLIAFEYIISFTIETQFYQVLPNKNFLSSKNSFTQVVILTQKLLLQVLQMVCELNRLTNLWIFTIPNLLLSSLNNYHFYTRLPFYNFQALFFKGKFLSIVLSLDIACFFHACLKGKVIGADIRMTIIVWVLTSILNTKLSNELIKRSNFFSRVVKGVPELLIHRFIVYTQLEKDMQTPGQKSLKYDWAYLFFTSQKAKIDEIFQTDRQIANEFETEIKGEEDLNIKYLDYLENLLIKFPQNSFIKLHIANLCSKSRNQYTKTIQIVTELSKNKHSHIYLNALLLLHKIEREIKHRDHSKTLDLLTYIKSQIYIEDVKKNMIDQIRLKMKICENITGEISDIGEIFNCSQLLNKLHYDIEKRINTLSNLISNYYISPLLLFAEYYLILNYSLEDYEKFQQNYTRRKSREEKKFQDDYLNEENLYQENNAFVIFSGQKLDNGTILYCSKSIEKICGGERKKYKSHISSIFEPSLQSYYKELFRETFELRTQSYLNQMLQKDPVFVCHRQNKYMIETQIHVQIHPYISENLYFNMIIRPIQSGKEYILMRENGDIQNGTKNISKFLGINPLSSNSMNIRQVSEELFKVNQAFNLLSKKRSSIQKVNKNSSIELFDKNTQSFRDSYFSKYSTKPSFSINFSEALNLYNSYSSEGKNVTLTPPPKGSCTQYSPRRYPYHCRVITLLSSSTNMKLIILDRAVKDITGKTKEEVDNEIETRREKAYTLRNFTKERFNSEEYNNTLSDNIASPERENLATDENPMSTRNFLSLKRTSLGLNTSNKVFFPNTPQTQILISNSSLPSEENEKEIYKTVNQIETINEDISGSQDISKHSKYKRQEKDFQRSLNSKYYSKAFSCWTLFFYTVILFSFASQIVLFSVFNSTMKDLIMKNDLLKFAQIRLYKMVLIHVNVMGVYLNIEGLVPVNDALREVTVPITNLRGHIPDLIHANQKIIQGLESVNTEVKKQLFLKDIAINGTFVESFNDEITLSVSQFQFIDKIVTALTTVLSHIDNLFTVEVSNLLYFVCRNVLDDFIYKNTEMTNLFVGFVHQEKEYFQNMIFTCLTLTPFLLFGVALMLVFIIGNQYKIEKNYMLAFVKLNHKKVKIIQRCLKTFERSLQKKEDFEERQSMKLFLNLTKFPKDQEDNSHKEHETQIIKYATIRSRYTKYVIKIVVYIAFLICILIANYLTASRSKQTIYHRQNQLQFANQISNSVSVNYATFAVLFSFNNTVDVNRVDAETAYVQQSTEIRELQGQLSTVFEELDNSYDPKIKERLFYNTDCEGLTGITFYYCDLLGTKYGQRTNLLPSFAIFESLITKKIQDYIDCDKSTIASILNASHIDQEIYLPQFVNIAGQAQLIANIVDQNLAESISNAETQRVIFLVVFSISLFGVSLMIWVQILSKLREVDNDFKKVLQVFPSSLILSSFLLKTFLKKTSKEIVSF